jgi:S1-C subfamily serine protease
MQTGEVIMTRSAGKAVPLLLALLGACLAGDTDAQILHKATDQVQHGRPGVTSLAAPATDKLGLSLRPLEEAEKKEAAVTNGLLVEDVSGPAERAGVQPGDVLLAVNGTPAVSVEQVRAATAASDKSVALLIQRGGEKIFVPVRLG